MNTSRAGSTEEHETETWGVGKNNADKTGQGKNTSAVNRAEAANKCKWIATDWKDGKDEKIKIKVDVVNERLNQTLHGEQVCIGMYECLFPLLKLCDDFVFPRIEKGFVDIILIKVRLFDNPCHSDGLGSLEIIWAKIRIR